MSLATEDGPHASVTLNIACFREIFTTRNRNVSTPTYQGFGMRTPGSFPRASTPKESHIRREREIALGEAFRDCSEPDWDGYGAAPANESSMAWAKLVLAALPSRLGVPEIAFEPDGDAGLEWWLGPNRALSVSVGRHGQLRYAVSLDAARVIATESFADGLPKRLVEAAFDLTG